MASRPQPTGRNDLLAKAMRFVFDECRGEAKAAMKPNADLRNSFLDQTERSKGYLGKK